MKKTPKLKLNVKSVQKLRQSELKAIVGGAVPMTGACSIPKSY